MATDEEEVVLCTIQIDSNGVLSINPDFNRGRKAYVKETMKEFGRGKLSCCKIKVFLDKPFVKGVLKAIKCHVLECFGWFHA